MNKHIISLINSKNPKETHKQILEEINFDPVTLRRTDYVEPTVMTDEEMCDEFDRLTDQREETMNNEDNPELDGLVDRIVKLAESISKESREAGNYIPIRDATLMDIVNTEMENK